MIPGRVTADIVLNNWNWFLEEWPPLTTGCNIYFLIKDRIRKSTLILT